MDVLVDRGISDVDKVGVGGHSYGAFMTANLLAHSDIFAAGIARSGAYNRTLTPFGFQSEQRTFWEVPELYFEMSPFMHADKINEPLLMIHGMADNNSGTFPIQSERMYHALKGHGGTVRLIMLPNESHGYRARESVMTALAEALHASPYMLMATATVAASCAFVLPVATPPNAIVMGSGRISAGELFREGLLLNLVAVLLTTLLCLLLGPLVLPM